MEEYELDCAQELLEEIHPLVAELPAITQALSRLSEKLDFMKHFRVSTASDGDCEQLVMFSEIVESQEKFRKDIMSSAWTDAVELVQYLVWQIELATTSRPGCLPRDEDACELMDLAFGIRGRILAGYSYR